MYLQHLAAVARRRWILVLIGLVAAFAASGVAWYVTAPTQQVSASLLLLPPKSTVPAEGNPLLQLGGLDLTVDLLGRSMSDQAVAQQVEQVAPDAEFSVAADPNSSGPILVVQVKDKSADQAIRVRDMLVKLATSRLADLQKEVGVSTPNQVTSSLLVADQEAEPVGRAKIEAGVIAAIGALGLSSVIIVLVDSALLRRRHSGDEVTAGMESTATSHDGSSAPQPERPRGEVDGARADLADVDTQSPSQAPVPPPDESHEDDATGLDSSGTTAASVSAGSAAAPEPVAPVADRHPDEPSEAAPPPVSKAHDAAAPTQPRPTLQKSSARRRRTQDATLPAPKQGQEAHDDGQIHP